MKELLINAVKNDLTPSLGVTEPGAISYAAACAARALDGSPSSVTVQLNSGIYKNSFTCAVPGTGGMGCALAAALGAVCGDPAKKLMATYGATEADVLEAKRLVNTGASKAELAAISPTVCIEAEVVTDKGTACALIEGRHDNLTKLTVNGKETPVEQSEARREGGDFKVSSATFDEILECVETAGGLEFLDEAVKMDLALYDEGERRGLMPLTKARCGGATVREEAERLTCGAIEARVRGAAAPAMAITGSGSHGILCMLPVYAVGKRSPYLRRALLLSALITTYIKEHSGLLSTACGCVLAGGTGAALGITYLMAKENGAKREALRRMLADALNSMAASVTGMICHGGNTGCSLKASVGVNMAFAAAEMAVRGVGAESVHGILGATPEETMRNMGRIACDMLPAEKTIIDIMSCKNRNGLL